MVVTSEESTQLKRLLVDMLSWFHVFCVENDLRYYILGGTMLGAARHKGFIPWDDDIDIGMPRKDYELLALLLTKASCERYVLETPHSNKEDFFYPLSKLYDTHTTLTENTRWETTRGIYLDIFPLDGAGSSEDEARAHFAPIKRKRRFLLSMTTGIREGRSFYKNAAIMATRLIPDWMINKKRLLSSLDQDCRSKDFDQCSWVGNMMGNWMEKELMPREYFGTPTKYRFENLTVYGAEKYDEYLTSLYGDWRQLPPEDKRKSHHDFLYMDLEKSYLEQNESTNYQP